MTAGTGSGPRPRPDWSGCWPSVGPLRSGRPEDLDIVFVTDRGRPLWHATKKGRALKLE